MKKYLRCEDSESLCLCVDELCSHHDECNIDSCEFAEREHCHLEEHEVYVRA